MTIQRLLIPPIGCLYALWDQSAANKIRSLYVFFALQNGGFFIVWFNEMYARVWLEFLNQTPGLMLEKYRPLFRTTEFLWLSPSWVSRRFNKPVGWLGCMQSVRKPYFGVWLSPSCVSRRFNNLRAGWDVCNPFINPTLVLAASIVGIETIE
ncbi:hypothetical protein [Commensalibacter sp. Nvir]|uniref:hypothetical protein n=1 Tax=Commensalibacter sp. Nvir TaxID=3069817 RepID=UPI0030C7EBF7